jgi:hypothetical protein
MIGKVIYTILHVHEFGCRRQARDTQLHRRAKTRPRHHGVREHQTYYNKE